MLLWALPLGASLTWFQKHPPIIPTVFPSKVYFADEEEQASEKALRTVCNVPAIVALTTGVVVYFISDDARKGQYHELKSIASFQK